MICLYNHLQLKFISREFHFSHEFHLSFVINDLIFKELSATHKIIYTFGILLQ